MAPPASPLTRQVTEDLRAMLSGAPDAANLARALRHLAKWRAHLVENTLRARSGSRVLGGPFKGMAYPVAASEGAGAARLLGSYEASLHPVIETIVGKRYDLIFDVGAAEGYYAVGLALRLPGAEVRAHDIDARARATCRALAEANGVAERVQIRAEATSEDFAACEGQRALVLCDIEGAEEALLDPDRAPGLAAADILVEVHELMRPDLCATLEARFAATHRITRIDRRLDDSALPAWMEEASDLDRLMALWEWRGGPTPWLWMERR